MLQLICQAKELLNFMVHGLFPLGKITELCIILIVELVFFAFNQKLYLVDFVARNVFSIRLDKVVNVALVLVDKGFVFVLLLVEFFELHVLDCHLLLFLLHDADLFLSVFLECVHFVENNWKSWSFWCDFAKSKQTAHIECGWNAQFDFWWFSWLLFHLSLLCLFGLFLTFELNFTF